MQRVERECTDGAATMQFFGHEFNAFNSVNRALCCSASRLHYTFNTWTMRVAIKNNVSSPRSLAARSGKGVG
jgi:hypothetical protein